MGLKTNAKKTAATAFACALALTATGASIAQAQGGGTVAPAPPTTSSPTPTAGGYTVVKKATWYGPGFWGEETACGMTLRPSVTGVAHKKLPCGTQVTFEHDGRTTLATVIDRGPYTKGFTWDLTKKTAKQVGFLDVGAGPITATVTPPAN